MKRFRSTIDAVTVNKTKLSVTSTASSVFEAHSLTRQQGMAALKQKEMSAMAAAAASQNCKEQPRSHKKRTALDNIPVNSLTTTSLDSSTEVSKKLKTEATSKSTIKPRSTRASDLVKQTNAKKISNGKLVDSIELHQQRHKETKMASSEPDLARCMISEGTTNHSFVSTESLRHNLEQIELDKAFSEDSSTEDDKQELVEEDWVDIDSDEKDEFNANDYVEYIFNYYRSRECAFEVDDYITRQPHLNMQMRHLLVDWMVEVQQQLEFNHEVLYLSVKLMDLYLKCRKNMAKERLQLLGGAAMFIACKFEERVAPIIDDFIYVSDNAYDRKELIDMEMDILRTVQYDIGVPLSYTFLRRYSKCLKADMRFLTLARYILELSLQHYSFCTVSDSHKACAALYLALKMTVSYERGIKATLTEPTAEQEAQFIVSSANLATIEWNGTLKHYTGLEPSEFMAYVPAMNNLLKLAPHSKYKTIFKKYSHPVFYEVAKVAPLVDSEIEFLVQQYPPVNVWVNTPNA